MKVRCRIDRQEHLPQEFLDARILPGEAVFFPGELTIGEEHVVYAMGVEAGQLWFYLCAGRGESVPFRYPSPAFDVIDGRISRSWVFDLVKTRHDSYPLLAFPEWVSDLAFYERLTDALEPELGIFRRYRLLMDAESEEPDSPATA